MRFSAAAMAGAMTCSMLLWPLVDAGAGQAPATPAAPAAVTPPDPNAPASDAAARHAKRTGCLKQAKAKKLVGAAKASFVKSCLAAP
jgi:hypothetical protein